MIANNPHKYCFKCDNSLPTNIWLPVTENNETLCCSCVKRIYGAEAYENYKDTLVTRGVVNERH